MKNFCLYIVTPLFSYLGGFIAYILTLRFWWGESLGNDGLAVLFFSGTAFLAVGVPIYFGIVHSIDKYINKYKGLLYIFGCMFIFFIPTLLFFGSDKLFSPEATLFHVFFLTSGLIFGLFNWYFKKM